MLGHLDDTLSVINLGKAPAKAVPGPPPGPPLPTLPDKSPPIMVETDEVDSSTDSPTSESPVTPAGRSPDFYFDYTIEQGHFLQEQALGRHNKHLGTVYDLTPNFGLIHRGYDTDSDQSPLATETDWDRFQHYLAQLNTRAPDDTEYTLVYLARHGQGYHNLGEEKVGTHVWERSSSIYDHGLCFHPRFRDAHLTPVGEDQADTLSLHFEDLVARNHLPLPQAYYVSPLHRACDTLQRTWGRIAAISPPAAETIPDPGREGLPASAGADDKPTNYHPQIHELLREQLLPHLCNSRSTVSQIATSFPAFRFAPDSHGAVTESDELWSATYREQNAQVTHRAVLALDDIFRECFNKPDRFGNRIKVISITCHAGFMSGIYRALGYAQDDIPRFPTGIVVPILLKVTRHPGTRPSVPKDPPSEVIVNDEANPPSPSSTISPGEVEATQHEIVGQQAPGQAPHLPPPRPGDSGDHNGSEDNNIVKSARGGYRPFDIPTDIWDYRSRPEAVKDPRFGRHHTALGHEKLEGMTLDKVLHEIFDRENYAKVKEQMRNGHWS